MAELLFDLPQEGARERPENADESPIVDGAALIDHDLAVLPVSSNPSRKGHAQKAFSGESGRAGKDPGGWMCRAVQQVGLDHEHRPCFSGFRAKTRIEIGEVERPAPDPHDSPRPSEARWSR
jgi:hypothetical protein